MPEWYTLLVSAVKDLGFPIAVAAYLLYRDWKFMGGLNGLMSRFDAFLDAQGVPPVTQAKKGA